MRYFLFILCLFCFQSSYAQKRVGVFENHVDVGNPKLAGGAAFVASDKSYELKGSGYNIWFERDEFHFLYNKIKGDFILTANFEFVGKGNDPHRKIGWMVRESLDKGAAHVSAVAHGDGLTVMQWRVSKDANMRDPQDELFFPGKHLQIIQLARSGKRFTMKVANTGERLQTVGSYEAKSMQDEVFAGLFICSHKEDVVEQARVFNVKIEKPKAKVLK